MDLVISFNEEERFSKKREVVFAPINPVGENDKEGVFGEHLHGLGVVVHSHKGMPFRIVEACIECTHMNGDCIGMRKKGCIVMC